jgi:hypothetical protein
MQLLDRRSLDPLLRLLPLRRLVQLQSPVRQVAGGTRALVRARARGDLATGVVELAEERAVGVVEDVNGAALVRHQEGWVGLVYYCGEGIEFEMAMVMPLSTRASMSWFYADGDSGTALVDGTA